MAKLIQMAKSSISLILMLSFIVAIIMPLHPAVIDVAIVLSFAISITVYMRASTIEEWDELKTFPTILLLTAIFRIALNITTTRKILADGHAGSFIEAAGGYIVGSNIWVGFVIFIILIVVQFIVANGAARTAEVNARFTLDGMPMKQMSIDNDLNNGLLTVEQAKERRKKLDMEVDFYGNMDGAGKFIKGDVILGIILFLVNIIFGFIIGVLVNGMPVAEAIQKYTILTIGDGLVNQLCSLLLAIAAGVVMTRVYSGEKENVTQGIFSELTKSPLVIYVVASLFVFLAIFTNLPFIPLALVAALLFYLGYVRSRKIGREKEKMLGEEKDKREEEQQMLQEQMGVDTEVELVTIELGIALIPLAEKFNNGNEESLTDKVQLMRKAIGRELGVKIPRIHVEDNSYLKPTSYRIKIKENVVAQGELRTNRLLALKTPYMLDQPIPGEPTKDPVFNEDAIWIEKHFAERATEIGYMIYDPLSILSTHLDDVVRKHLHLLLQRQEVQNLLEQLSEKHKVLLKEVEKADIPLSVIQGVLQNLLRESISIRDLSTIIEAVIDGAVIVENSFNSEAHHKVDEITSIVRERISSYICERSKHKDGKMHVILLDPNFEKEIELIPRFDGYYAKMSVEEEQKFIEESLNQIQRAQMAEISPVLFISRPGTRTAISRMFYKYKLPIGVVSSNELVQGVAVEQLGMIKIS